MDDLWIFVTVFGSMAVGVALISLLKRPREIAIDPGTRIPPDEFHRRVEAILQRMQFDVLFSARSNGMRDYEIVARSNEPLRRGRTIVHVVCPETGGVESESVMHLHEQTKAEEARGILITDAAFSEIARKAARATQLELIDGRELDVLEQRLPKSAPAASDPAAV